MSYPFAWAPYPPVPYPVVVPTVSPRGSPRRYYEDEYYRAHHQYSSPVWPAYAPLPPSPSFLPAWIPLPPSPHVSPGSGMIPLPPPLTPPRGIPQYLYPHDPYFTPVARMYTNCYPLNSADSSYPTTAPPQRVQLHPLINGDSLRQDLILDLSMPTVRALVRSPNPNSAYSPVHRAYLSQPAVIPPTSHLKITYPEFSQYAEAAANGWAVTVGPGSGGGASGGPPVTVEDVLKALHSSLRAPVSQIEWSRVSSAAKLDIAEAYTRRCRAAGSAAGGSSAELERELGQGVRRIDFLRNKCLFAGLQRQRDDDNENFKLVVRER